MSPLTQTIAQLLVSFVIVATLGFFVWLIVNFVRKPQSVSGETWLYSKPSDTDFFDKITEFRNDISR